MSSQSSKSCELSKLPIGSRLLALRVLLELLGL